MLKFANAKINIGLHITGKREDGYHELETVFSPVPIYDAIEVLPASDDSFEVIGDELRADQNNLCIRALDLLRQKMQIPPLAIRLLKRIPIGAGLGGGSADATATLMLVNEVLSLNLTTGQLAAYAAKLGADCPFFLSKQAMFAKGIGTELAPVRLDLKNYDIVIVKPSISIATAEAYAGVTPKRSAVDLRQAINLPIQEWKYMIRNDFECSIFDRYPQLARLKNRFYEMGAYYASMSGSGSAVYGIFDRQERVYDALREYGEVFCPAVS